MKNTITLLIALLISISTFAQGIGMNYKALIKDASGNVLANQTIDVRFNILGFTGTSVYAESHTTTTDSNGIVILIIGDGTPISGSFFSINWAIDLYQLQTEIDPEQDGTFLDLGTTPFNAVPYAFSSMDNLWQLNGDDAIALGEKVGIGTSTPEELLSLEDFNNASIKLKASATNDITGIIFENGDNTGFYSNYKIENTNDRLRISVDSDITAGTGYNEIINIANNGTINTDGSINAGTTISAQNGTSINEFSTDVTLFGNSNSAVPTEAAVKTYVDNKVGSNVKEIVIPASAFQARSGTNAFNNITTTYISSGDGRVNYLTAPVIVPTGNRIVAINFVYIDNDSSDDLRFRFYKSCGNNTGSTLIQEHVIYNTTGPSVRNYQFTFYEVVANECQYFITATAVRPGNPVSDWSSDLSVVKCYIMYESY